MHGKYEQIGTRIGSLVDKKNKAYGNSFHEAHRFLEVLWPHSIPLNAYPLVMAFTRILDKMFRMATDPDAFDEDPAADLVGYCLLLAGMKDGEKVNPKEGNNRI